MTSQAHDILDDLDEDWFKLTPTHIQEVIRWKYPNGGRTRIDRGPVSQLSLDDIIEYKRELSETFSLQSREDEHNYYKNLGV